MNILKEIRTRRSVRNFSGEKIEPDVLNRILDAGRCAPSAKNRQSWRFVVILNDNNKKRIADYAYGEEFFLKAGAVVAFCTTNVDYKMPNGQLSYPIDISFACSFMMLQAQAEGLATNVVTTYQESEIRDFLTVPYSMRVVMLLVIGHSAEKEEQELIRKKLNQVVSFEHW